MNKKNLKAIYFEDHRKYYELVSALKGMVSNIDLAFDNGADECLNRAEQVLLSNSYDRIRKFYDFADEVQEELEEEGWDTSYSPWSQGYKGEGQ
tara:strand:+ start:25 stop:306 length:282 start_codon:yes stop_codon:yes gene_type:complete